jgi:hypothetical protein
VSEKKTMRFRAPKKLREEATVCTAQAVIAAGLRV